MHVIPDGDVLIISGDATENGKHWEYQAFCKTLKELPHPIKLFTPGNHERGLEQWPPEQIQSYLGDACEVLIDKLRVIEGLRIYGFPWGTMFGKTGWGYTAQGDDMEQKLLQIPADCDVLVAHYPPLGILDLAMQSHKCGPDGRPGTPPPCILCGDAEHEGYGHWGMIELLAECQSKRPAAMLFGHVHDQNGTCVVDDVVYSNGALWSSRSEVASHNVASVIDFWLPSDLEAEQGAVKYAQHVSKQKRRWRVQGSPET